MVGALLSLHPATPRLVVERPITLAPAPLEAKDLDAVTLLGIAKGNPVAAARRLAATLLCTLAREEGLEYAIGKNCRSRD